MTDYEALARFYDLEHSDYDEDLPMYAGFAAAVPANRWSVLELACGTGRCLLPLAARGVKITGLDNSPGMLELARQKVEAAALEHRVRLVQGDMRDFDLGGMFHFIFIALNSLMHLETPTEQRRALACAARHLADGGRLLVDLFNPQVALPDEQQEGLVFLHCARDLPDDGQRLHFQSPRVDRAAQVLTMANYYDDVASDGQVRRLVAPFQMRYLMPGELELLLELSGLRIEALYGTYDLDLYEATSPRLIAVAGRA